MGEKPQKFFQNEEEKEQEWKWGDIVSMEDRQTPDIDNLVFLKKR